MTLPQLSSPDNVVPWSRSLIRALESGALGGGDRTVIVNPPSGGGTGTANDDAKRPEAFGADPTGTANATAAVQAALDAAGDGGRVRLEGSYLVTRTLLHRGGITIDGDGEIIVGDNAGPAVLNLEVTPLAELAVTAVDNQAAAIFSGNQNTVSDCARITLAAPSTVLKVGAVAKLMSTDQQAGLEPGKGRGEFVHIQAVEGNGTIAVTTARLANVYQTGIKLVILDASKVIDVEGIRFRTTSFDTAVAQDWAFAYLRIFGAVAPSVRGVRMQDGTDIGLQFQGCIGHHSEGVRVRRMRNAIDSVSAGYGIQDGGCAYGQHLGGYFEDCRHAYTTVGHTTATNPAAAIGRNVGTVVSGCVAFACSAGAFDTHSDADGVTFIGCTADAGYQGRTSSYSGFQLRGQRCKAVGCSVRGHKFGYVFFKQIDGEETNHVAEACTYDGPGTPFRQFGNSTSPIFGTLIGFRYRTTNPIGIRLQGSLRVFGGEFDYRGVDNAGHTFELDEDPDSCTLVAEDFKALFKNGTGTNCRVVAFQGDNVHKVRLRGEVEVGTLTWQGVISTSNVAKRIDVQFEVDADKAPSNPIGHFNLSAGSTIAGVLTIKRGRTSSSARIVRNSQTVDFVLDPVGVFAPVLVFDIGVTGAGVNITDALPGLFVGQLAMITCRTGSSNNLTVDSAGLLAIGAARTLTPGESAFLMWEGAKWVSPQ